MPLTQVQGAMVGPTGFANLSGITFPATQVPSADANTLDDYEEGTWTPNVGGNATYGIQQGIYIKVGKQVTVWFDMLINTLGTGSTTTLSGLPFTSASNSFVNTSGNATTYWATSANPVSYITWRVDSSSTQLINAFNTSSTTTLGLGIAFFTNSTRLICTVTYQTS